MRHRKQPAEAVNASRPLACALLGKFSGYQRKYIRKCIPFMVSSVNAFLVFDMWRGLSIPQENFVFILMLDQGNLMGESAVAAILPSHMEGELLFLWIYLLLCPTSNFVQRVLPFLHGLKIINAVRLLHGKYTATIIFADCAE